MLLAILLARSFDLPVNHHVTEDMRLDKCQELDRLWVQQRESGHFFKIKVLGYQENGINLAQVQHSSCAAGSSPHPKGSGLLPLINALIKIQRVFV